MSEALQAIVWVLGGIGAAGVFFCGVLLCRASQDRREYRLTMMTENGRPFMVIRTAMRRYAIKLVMFALTLMIVTVSVLADISIERTVVNTFAFMVIMLLALVNAALDAKDDRDLVAYGVRESTLRDSLRDAARDTGRDATRDQYRDDARDAERDRPASTAGADMAERDLVRDVARDEGRDHERDEYRDTARDAEHDAKNDGNDGKVGT